MLKKLIVLAGVMVLSTPVLAADDRGSMEDQLACTPDVYRLCSQYIPDEKSIVACLQKNVSVLGAGCRKVFTRPDTPAKPGSKDDDD